ncbi:MAG: RnfABCDGE type electron transport complex subunit B [Clostridia bacterium]|nr:RnfABCDGE type electron transport complex subunit B [Clostridia bacterium]MBR2176857.1 RnfABCDGE type electron transport complex subunit B [Clostridia bacterium]
MDAILTAVIPVVIIGVICAAVLVIASKLMAVKEDERFPVVRECLPGANCGACGFAGCDGYAKALCENPDTPSNLCVPGADAVSKKLSEILGVEFEDVVEQVAVVHCAGDCNKTQDKFVYHGIESCAAAKLLYGGKGSCTYGCLGLGDCANACPKNAIYIKDGTARVNQRECIGCGICTKTCPNHIISLVADVEKAVVTCSNKDKGAVTRKVCSNGCIGCKKCERVCPSKAIKVIDNVAVIDYSKCPDCEDFGVCAKNCTTGCIMISDLSGIHRFKEEEEK